MSDTNALLVLTTCANTREADALAAGLVEAKLAACVNACNPVTSTYLWQGKIEREQEVLLLIKTTRGRFAALEEQIRARSSYDVPEIVAVPIDAGSADYLGWIEASVGQ
jgi:periplasmic divalent cation tolerance protein